MGARSFFFLDARDALGAPRPPEAYGTRYGEGKMTSCGLAHVRALGGGVGALPAPPSLVQVARAKGSSDARTRCRYG